MSHLIIKTVHTLHATYHHLLYDLADHRSDDWFLMGSPWPTVFILIVYVYFVAYLGPQLMKDRPSLNLDRVINMYNLFQILACTYLILRAFMALLTWKYDIRWLCEPVNYSTEPEALDVLAGIYYYYLLKIFDLLDTIFIVLRKKDRQLSFLHIYHHAFMLMFTWVWTKYVPGGHGAVAGVVNCFVHIWVYLYYFLTSKWPEYKKKIWWKKYITQLQMLQFLFLFVHSLPVVLREKCGYPFPAGVSMCIANKIFFFMFFDYYRNAYNKTKNS